LDEIEAIMPPPPTAPANSVVNLFAALLPTRPYDRDLNEIGGPLLCSGSGKGDWTMVGIVGESPNPLLPLSERVAMIHPALGDDSVWIDSVLKKERH